MGWVAGTLTEALGNPAAIRGLWDANIFFPESQALAFSESFIAQSTMAWPVYRATGNLLLGYNLDVSCQLRADGVGHFPACPRVDRKHGRRIRRRNHRRIQRVPPRLRSRTPPRAVDSLVPVRIVGAPSLFRNRCAPVPRLRRGGAGRAELVVDLLHGVLRAVRGDLSPAARWCAGGAGGLPVCGSSCGRRPRWCCSRRRRSCCRISTCSNGWASCGRPAR